MKLSYIGSIEEGKLIFTAPTRNKMIADIQKYEGKRMEIIISRLPKRSSKQNAYYWGVVVGMITERLTAIGHRTDNDTTHAMLAEKFNGQDICNAEGEFIGRIANSTTEMNKVDFMDYLAKIMEWAATYLGLNIPLPNEQAEMNFEAA